MWKRLRSGSWPAVAVSAVLISPAMRAQGEFAVVRALQLGQDVAATESTTADVDGDGRADLIVAVTENGQPYRRAVRVHLAPDGRAPYPGEPDARVRLPPDVVAICVADVHPADGAEVVLLSSTRAVTWRPIAPEKERFARLAEGEFLWQVPDAWTVILWDRGVVDLDHDGLDDLVLPVPGGYRVLRQDRTADGVSWATGAELRLPRGQSARTQMRRSNWRSQARARTSRVGLSFAEDYLPPGPMLDVTEVIPAPWTADWDGDGDEDVLALSSTHLMVWRQEAGARFAAAPELMLEVPVVGDLKRRFDVTYGAHVADVDRDGRADCVFLAGDYRTDDVRTQVLLFVQGDQQPALFGPEGLPRQLLVLGGFAGPAQLTDVDGDGAPDLVVGTLRTSFVETLGSKVSDKLEAELYVYPNRGTGFAKRPGLSHTVTVRAEDLRKAATKLAARFFGDITGDGTQELLLRTDPTRIEVQMLRNRGGKLSIPSRALWELTVNENARLSVQETGAPRPDLLVIEPKQVLHVRFP